SSEELLDVTQGGCCHAVIINQPEIQSDSETTEIELGAGIVPESRRNSNLVKAKRMTFGRGDPKLPRAENRERKGRVCKLAMTIL
ncbi:hypothetical protein JTE90_028176, partial [Oedothorax gibbosus]